MGALIAAALGMAGPLMQILGGKRAGDLAKAAAEAIVGTSDPEAIRNLPPDQQAELRKELARIALAEHQANLQDVQHARETGARTSLIAYAQVTGAAIVLGIWGFMALRLALYGLPAGNETLFSTTFAGVSGVLGAVQQFFFGNSTASNAANARMDVIAARAPLALPAVPTADALNEASLQAARAQR